MNRIRSSDSWSAASAASHRWPMCGGSNVPPRDPDALGCGRRSDPLRLRGRARRRSHAGHGVATAPPATAPAHSSSPHSSSTCRYAPCSLAPRPGGAALSSIPIRSRVRWNRSRDSSFEKSIRACRRFDPSAADPQPALLRHDLPSGRPADRSDGRASAARGRSLDLIRRCQAVTRTARSSSRPVPSCAETAIGHGRRLQLTRIFGRAARAAAGPAW